MGTEGRGSVGWVERREARPGGYRGERHCWVGGRGTVRWVQRGEALLDGYRGEVLLGEYRVEVLLGGYRELRYCLVSTER